MICNMECGRTETILCECSDVKECFEAAEKVVSRRSAFFSSLEEGSTGRVDMELFREIINDTVANLKQKYSWYGQNNEKNGFKDGGRGKIDCDCASKKIRDEKILDGGDGESDSRPTDATNSRQEDASMEDDGSCVNDDNRLVLLHSGIKRRFACSFDSVPVKKKSR